MTNLKKLLDERRAIQEEQDLFKAALKEVNDAILKVMEDEGADKLTVDGEAVTVVRQGPKIDYDWNVLRSSISDEDWNSITVEIPNKDLLDKAIADGRIGLSKVKESVIEVPGSKPFLRITKKK